MSSDEKFYCLDCKALDTLTINLRCAHCDSDNVISSAIILKEAQKRSSDDDITRHFFHVEYQDFETMVSTADAKDEESAIKYALQDKLQPWYAKGISPELRSLHPQAEVGVKCTIVTRAVWCEWVRSRN